MFWSVLIYPPLSTNIDVEKKHRVDHFPRDGLPGLPLRGPGCGKWWNPVDLHRASESIWWNPSNCKGIRWRRLPISSRHAVFIYIYIYPYPYRWRDLSLSVSIYIYIHVHVYTCILHINTLCQCNFELMEGELSWEQGPWYGSFFHQGWILVMEPYPEKWHGIFREQRWGIQGLCEWNPGARTPIAKSDRGIFLVSCFSGSDLGMSPWGYLTQLMSWRNTIYLNLIHVCWEAVSVDPRVIHASHSSVCQWI